MASNSSSTSDDWAHSPPIGSGMEPHSLDSHSRSVGSMAESFVGEALAPLAKLAGIWHDMGKRRIGFQKYIQQTGGIDAHIEGRVPDADKTHSAAGALWAERYLSEVMGLKGRLLSRLLQYVIAGHHAGLADEDALAKRLACEDAQRELRDTLERTQPDDLLRPDIAELRFEHLPPLNEHKFQTPGRLALWLRMLFSALVDADFLDTEAYMNPQCGLQREAPVGIAELGRVLDAYLDSLAFKASGHVNQWRASVLAQCRAKAELPSGVFSLSVPTGGGKTLSSLAFALNHAARHDKRRVIYAIPYTSIIEQTADVFRQVFQSLGEEVVIEHHSNAESDPKDETTFSRLACENWDAPLIVTTNVQLFESLFATRTSRCRKLHNLARSVIVLDEAQLLPTEFLQPIVDVLRYLVQDHGVTLLLCTATQPVLDTPIASADPTRGLSRGICLAVSHVTEIIGDVPALYRALERVQVHLPTSLQTPRSWPELADEIASHEAVLAIVSRRADAAELHRLVSARCEGTGCWHLSALMCAQHRSDTIAKIKAALAARREALAAGGRPLPVRVIATQLVEAGVDLDFPVVYRALAGLDAIAQAAGRCNREGKLPEPGQVHVFVPPTQAPPGLLALARSTCQTVLHDLPPDPLALPLMRRYFERLLYDTPSIDAKQICAKLKLNVDAKTQTLPLQLRTAADNFRLIDKDDGATVIVRYRSPNASEDINTLIALLERQGPSRRLMRKLQRYSVTIYQHQVKALLRNGDILELPNCPGLYLQPEGWDGLYDPVLGVKVDSAPGDPAMFVQ